MFEWNTKKHLRAFAAKLKMLRRKEMSLGLSSNQVSPWQHHNCQLHQPSASNQLSTGNSTQHPQVFSWDTWGALCVCVGGMHVCVWAYLCHIRTLRIGYRSVPGNYRCILTCRHLVLWFIIALLTLSLNV